MISEIPVTQARDELADLINRVAYGHERIVLTRHSSPSRAWCRRKPRRLQDEGQARISLTSAGPEPGVQPSAGPGVLPIAAQHQPGGQHRP